MSRADLEKFIQDWESILALEEDNEDYVMGAQEVLDSLRERMEGIRTITFGEQ